MEDLPPINFRHANLNDLPALRRLADLATRVLCARDYTPAQIDALLAFTFPIDPQPIRDRTYFVAEHEDRIVAAGGWTHRLDLSNIEDPQSFAAATADPQRRTTARLRPFFVHPEVARRGIGRTLLALCTTAAARARFTRAEILATRTGQHLFRTAGFTPTQAVTTTFPNGVTLESVRMHRHLDPVLSIPSPRLAHPHAYVKRVV